MFTIIVLNKKKNEHVIFDNIYIGPNRRAVCEEF